jgi:hypothetical protein
MMYLVEWSEGQLSVEVDVSVELRGGDYEFRVNAWWINGVDQNRIAIPEALKRDAFDLAYDEYREDYS